VFALGNAELENQHDCLRLVTDSLDHLDQDDCHCEMEYSSNVSVAGEQSVSVIGWGL
jgi:hypothetical protein